VVGSSLTAVDLGGLTRVELGYAVVLAAAAAGLVLALGLAERRRSFAIIAALGARSRQLGVFVWGEAVVVAVAGLSTGAAGGWLLAHMLVKVLTGVFDPPPSQLQLPWVYVSAVAVLAVASIAVAAEGTIRAARRPAVELLRDL
jgi:putative ABC transport system permease protein